MPWKCGKPAGASQPASQPVRATTHQLVPAASPSRHVTLLAGGAVAAVAARAAHVCRAMLAAAVERLRRSRQRPAAAAGGGGGRGRSLARGFAVGTCPPTMLWDNSSRLECSSLLHAVAALACGKKLFPGSACQPLFCGTRRASCVAVCGVFAFCFMPCRGNALLARWLHPPFPSLLCRGRIQTPASDLKLGDGDVLHGHGAKHMHASLRGRQTHCR